MKMTEEWRQKIRDIYQREGQSYYNFLKECRKHREGLESAIVFDLCLEEVEKIKENEGKW